jgi:hypothetical protein
MKRKDFYKQASVYLKEPMAKYGFVLGPSKYSSFWRKIDEDIFQLVGPDHRMRGDWFDGKIGTVFRFLNQNFEERFPDKIGFVHLPYLSQWGVGVDQQS